MKMSPVSLLLIFRVVKDLLGSLSPLLSHNYRSPDFEAGHSAEISNLGAQKFTLSKELQIINSNNRYADVDIPCLSTCDKNWLTIPSLFILLQRIFVGKVAHIIHFNFQIWSKILLFILFKVASYPW